MGSLNPLHTTRNCLFPLSSHLFWSLSQKWFRRRILRNTERIVSKEAFYCMEPVPACLVHNVLMYTFVNHMHHSYLGQCAHVEWIPTVLFIGMLLAWVLWAAPLTALCSTSRQERRKWIRGLAIQVWLSSTCKKMSFHQKTWEDQLHCASASTHLFPSTEKQAPQLNFRLELPVVIVSID